jgi:hypothetical protein
MASYPIGSHNGNNTLWPAKIRFNRFQRNVTLLHCVEILGNHGRNINSPGTRLIEEFFRVAGIVTVRSRVQNIVLIAVSRSDDKDALVLHIVLINGGHTLCHSERTARSKIGDHHGPIDIVVRPQPEY